MTDSAPDKTSRWLAPAIFCTIFFAYMAATSRERPWGDANPVYRVAENLVAHGTLHVDSVRWPPDAPPGRNGKYYAPHPLLPSLIHVPGAAVYRIVTSFWPATSQYALPLACHLGPSALGALTCLLFFWLCRDHGVSPRFASIGTLVVGFATTTWVYARYPYTEILQVACFTGFFLTLLRVLDLPSDARARAFGLWAGVLLDSKLIYAVGVAGAGLLVAWTLRKDWRRLRSVALWAGLTMLPSFGLIFFYNWARYGSIFNSGYGGAGALFVRGNAWEGFWGMFLSPGKSLFLYSPPLLLSLVALPKCVARYPRTLVAMVLTIVPPLFVNARFPFWSGDFAWGPRYVVFAVPVLALPALLYLKESLPVLRWKLVAPTAALVIAGVFVQVLGSVFYWDHFIRLSMEARARWLGQPNRGGSVTPDRGGYCDACFEDMYPLLWLPPFQPIVGHYWAFKHVVAGHDWKRAEADAPWHTHTSLKLDISGTYQRFRLDWWILDYEKDRAAAALLMILMLSLSGESAYLWWRCLRPGRNA